MSENNIETKENDLEVETTELEVLSSRDEHNIDSYRASIEDMEWLAKNIGKIADLQKTIFTSLLKMTVPGDFMVFGSGEKKRAEIGTAACERIARVGVNIIGAKMVKEKGKDDKGEFYTYTATGKATFRGRSIDVINVVSSRDKFYGKESGGLKDISDISETDVKKACWRGLIKEGVKSLLGLRRLDPNELEKEYKIKLVGSGSYDFKSKDEKSEEIQTANIAVQEVLIKRGDKWNKYTISDTEGVNYTTFSDTLGAEAKRVKESKEVVSISFVKDQYGLKLISINDLTSPK